MMTLLLSLLHKTMFHLYFMSVIRFDELLLLSTQSRLILLCHFLCYFENVVSCWQTISRKKKNQTQNISIKKTVCWLPTRHPCTDQKAQSLLRGTPLTRPLSPLCRTVIWVTVLELTEVDEKECCFIRSSLAAGWGWQEEERSGTHD